MLYFVLCTNNPVAKKFLYTSEINSATQNLTRGCVHLMFPKTPINLTENYCCKVIFFKQRYKLRLLNLLGIFILRNKFVLRESTPLEFFHIPFVFAMLKKTQLISLPLHPAAFWVTHHYWKNDVHLVCRHVFQSLEYCSPSNRISYYSLLVN